MRSTGKGIKIFGERNSGTNALGQLIRRNSASTVHPGTPEDLSWFWPRIFRRLRDYGMPPERREPLLDWYFRGRPILCSWKHRATDFADDPCFADTHFIFTVRQPHSWLLGLYRSPYHLLGPKPASFEAFCEAPWRVCERDQLPEPAYLPSQLVEEKLRSYERFMAQLDRCGGSWSIIRFEDFVADQACVFDSLRMQLKTPAEHFQPLTRSTKDTSKSLEHYRAYYGEERWRDEVPPGIFESVAFDKALWGRFGYKF